jgi:hypothetical protein
MPPIVFIGSVNTVQTAGAPGSHIFTGLPARTAVGDLLVAVFNVTLNGDCTPVPNDGSWLVQLINTSATNRIYIACRLRKATDGPSYTFTSFATWGVSSLLVYRGADMPTLTSLAWTGQNITAQTAFLASGQNLVDYSDMLITVAAVSSGAVSFTPDPQMTERVDFNAVSAGSSRSLSIDDYQPNVVGIVTQRTMTASASATGNTASIRIKALPTPNATVLRSDAVGALGFTPIGV